MKKKEKEICKDYINGLTNKKIAEKYEVHRTTIQRILKRNGVELKSLSETARKYEIINFNNGITNSNDAYILGLIFSDGNLSRNCIEISLHHKDKQILSDISKYVYGTEILGYRKGKKMKGYQCAPQYRFRITSKEIVNKLRPIGLKENKSLTLQYPKIQPKFDRDFIRGYFDGDGSISVPKIKNNSRVNFVGSHDFCELLSNKLKEYLDVNVSLKLKTDNVSSVNIYGRLQVMKFYNWLYQEDELKLNRKYNKFDEIY